MNTNGLMEKDAVFVRSRLLIVLQRYITRMTEPAPYSFSSLVP